MLSTTTVFLSLALCAFAAGPIEFRVKLDEEFALDSEVLEFPRVMPYAFEGTINKSLNKLFNKIADPLIVPKYVFKTNGPQLKADVLIENLRYLGARTIAATYLKFNVLKSILNGTIHIGVVDLTLRYDIGARALFVPIYGKGNLDLQIRDIDIDIDAKLALGQPEKLKEFDIRFRAQSLTFKITGFLDNEPLSDIISDAVTETVPDFIRKYGPTIAKKLSKVIQEAVNKPKPGGDGTTDEMEMLVSLEELFAMEDEY